jgi:hypothetical protein
MGAAMTVLRMRQAAAAGEAYGPELAPATTAANFPAYYADSSVSNVGGKLRVTAGGYNVAAASSASAIAVENGATYLISANATPGPANARIQIGPTRGSSGWVSTGDISGAWSTTFVASATTVYVTPALNSWVDGYYAEFDSISLKKVL